MKTISFSDTVVDMAVSWSEQLLAVMSTMFFDVYHLGTLELVQYVHNKRGAGTNQKIVFTADGGIIVLASEGVVMRWERKGTKTWTVKLHWPLHQQKNFYHCFEHQPGQYVFGHNNFVFVVDRAGTILFEYDMGWNSAHMALVGEHVMLVSYALPCKIRFATFPPCRFITEKMIVMDHVVKAIAVSFCYIAVGYQNTVDFYSLNQKVFSLQIPTPRIKSLGFTPDGSFLWVITSQCTYLISMMSREIRQWEESLEKINCITNSKAIVSVGEQVKWITFVNRSLLLSMLYGQSALWIKPFTNRFVREPKN